MKNIICVVACSCLCAARASAQSVPDSPAPTGTASPATSDTKPTTDADARAELSSPHSKPAPAAPSSASSREGSTFGLSVGLGIGISSPGFDLGDPTVGLGGINLEIGRFLSPMFALIFKSSAVTTFPELNSGSAIITRGIWAVAAQVWVSDLFKIEAGPGMHYSFGITANGGGGGVAPGLYLAPAVQVAELDGGHGLQVAIEATNGFYNGGSAGTVALVFAWQSL